jgi:hypothetical protein
MGLSKPNQKKDRLALTTKTYIDWTSPDAACRKFLIDLESYGVKVDDNIKPKDIRNVYFLIIKERVTDRLFAIYSINFSRENS